MAQDLVKSGVELPVLMTAGRWKKSEDAGAVNGEAGRRPGGRRQVPLGTRKLKMGPKSPLGTRLTLKALSVNNLRSLRDMPAVPLEPDLTILVGQNGGGKTSFIDALNMLLQNSRPREESRSESGQDITVTGEFRSVDETESITVRARYSTGSVQREIEQLVHPTFGDLPENMTIQNLRTALTDAGVTHPGGTAKAPFVEAASSWIAQRRVGELEAVWVPLLVQTSARLPKLTIFRPEDAADQPTQLTRLITQESHRLLTTEAYSPRLNDMVTELQTDIEPVLSRIKEMIRTYCPGIASVEVDTNFEFSRVSPQVKMMLTKNTGESINLNETGSGLMQRVALAVYAANLETLQGTSENTVGTLLAYDEPDSHLDYQAQRELFEIIWEQCRFATCTSSCRNPFSQPDRHGCTSVSPTFPLRKTEDSGRYPLLLRS